MNANNIESKFAAMGARLKVREIASRWRQGDRTWTSPNDFAVDNPNAVRWNWRVMQRDAGVYARGTVRHSDHATITLPFWHRVIMNTETQSRTMANVAFLD